MGLLVVGTVAFDQIESPFGKTGRILGGAATHIGLAASHFTDNIHLVSVVGDDFPAEWLDLLKKRHIDTSGICVVPGEKSFFWAGRYHRNMNHRDTLVTELNVLAGFNPVVPPAMKQSRYLMLGNLTPSIQQQVIMQMERRPRLICVDTMNFWMDTAWDDLLQVLRLVDVLAVNEEEARQLSGEYSLIKAARRIKEMGPEILIVKKGEHGAMLFYADKVFIAPAMPLEDVFDPTGAGDAFAGGFMGHIAKTGDISFAGMRDAMVYGSVIASFSVEAFGTDGLLNVSPEAMRSRWKEFTKLTACNG